MLPLSRPCFKASFALAIFFTLAIVVIRSQPYEIPSLLMSSDGCFAPCFLSIRPGITTMDEAIVILQNHELVEKVSVTSADKLSWKWNLNAPPSLWQGQYRNFGRLFADQGIVKNIEFRTGMPLGEAWILWGKPENYTTFAQSGGPALGPRPSQPIALIYSDKIVVGRKDCPSSFNLWEGRTDIIFGEPANYFQWVSTLPPLAGDISITGYMRDLTGESCRS